MSNNKKKEKKKKRGLLVKLIWLAFLGPIIGLATALIITAFTNLPSLEELENPKSNLATEVFTTDGVVMGKYYKENRTHVAYHEISPNVINALVATEDERFHSHSGVDAYALGRAVFFMGKRGGGSTLTQQLALNLYNKRASGTLNRIKQKLGEWIVSTRLEKRYTKEEIITMYLNKVDFLNQGVGINSASNVYFDKTPKDLNIQEAAMLVGMVKNPNGYNPKRFPEAAKKRREQVLFQMKKNGLLNQQQYDSIRELPLGLNFTKVDHKTGMAPYFREMLRGELKEMFAKTDANGNPLYYNKEQNRLYDLYKDGLRIYTTIDSRMQQYAEFAVKEHLGKELQKDLDRFIDRKNGWYTKNPPFVNSIKKDVVNNILTNAKKQTLLYKKLTGNTCFVCERPGTTKKKIEGKMSYVCDYNHKHVTPVKTDKEVETIFNTPTAVKVFDWNSPNYEKDTVLSPMDVIRYNKRFLRSSLMSMDPKNGYIKAWVGGPNFKYFQYDMVKKGKRQVGSTFKPFVYATAIDEGKFTPCSLISNTLHCVDIEHNNRRNKQWCPKNAGSPMDGLDVTVKYALAGSMNNITAKIIDEIKPQNVINNVEKMGFEKGVLQPYPSIALGVFDLSLYDMVGGVSTFANKGIYVEPVFITRIEDKKGNIIFESEPQTNQVFDPHTSYTTLQMMKGVTLGVQHPSKQKPQKGWIASTSSRLRAPKSKKRPYTGITNPVACKTGTTNDNTDGWFLGLTPELVTGVWTGCEDKGVRFTSTHYGQGANMALPIWGYYMNKIYEDSTLKISTGDFEMPENHIDIFQCDGDEERPIDGGYFDFNSGLGNI